MSISVCGFEKIWSGNHEAEKIWSGNHEANFLIAETAHITLCLRLTTRVCLSLHNFNIGKIWGLYCLFPFRKFAKTLGAFDMFVNVILLTGLFITTLFGIVRGLAALNSPFPLSMKYAHLYEPYVLEPSKFGSAWILYVMTIGSLFQVIVLSCCVF